MNGFRINKDEKHVEKIIKGLIKKDGYCPCKLQKTQENLCPCDEFMQEEVCHCNLWVKDEL